VFIVRNRRYASIKALFKAVAGRGRAGVQGLLRRDSKKAAAK